MDESAIEVWDLDLVGYFFSGYLGLSKIEVFIVYMLKAIGSYDSIV